MITIIVFRKSTPGWQKSIRMIFTAILLNHVPRIWYTIRRCVCVHKHLKILHWCALENTTPYPQIHPCFKYYLIEIQKFSLGWRITLFKRHFSKRVYVKWDLIFGNLVETLDARHETVLLVETQELWP